MIFLPSAIFFSLISITTLTGYGDDDPSIESVIKKLEAATSIGKKNNAASAKAVKHVAKIAKTLKGTTLTSDEQLKIKSKLKELTARQDKALNQLGSLIKNCKGKKL